MGKNRRGKVRENNPMMAPTEDAILTACSALNNNALRITETKGSDSCVKVSYPPELLKGLRGLFPAGRSYSFQVHASQTLGTDGAGSAKGAVEWSPAISSYAEWTALAALFDECKIRSSRLDISTALGPASAVLIPQWAFAPEFGPVSASSYVGVQRLAESRFLNPICAWKVVVMRARVPPRDWATTVAPVGATGLIAGMLGRWTYANDSPGTNSLTYMRIAMSNVVVFRMRA